MLFQAALNTPPAPAARGGIKAACRGEATEEDSSGEHKAFVEQARTGIVRSTVRVLTKGESKKTLWAEVRETQSPNHHAMMRKIAQAVNEGRVACKEDALAMKDKLLSEDH